MSFCSSIFDEVKNYKEDYNTLCNFLSLRYSLEFDKSGNERHDKSLKIKTSNGYISDFNGSFSGDIIDFIAFKENVSNKEALELFAKFCNVSTYKATHLIQEKPIKEDKSYLKNTAYSLQADFNLANEDFMECHALQKTFFDGFRLFMHLCKLNFLKDNEFDSILKDYFAYSKDDKSLAFIIKDKGEIKSVAIREKFFKDELVKWYKIKGSSNKFIKLIKAKERGLFKEYCFIFSGIKEIIVSEFLGLNAICFQSDSVMKNIHSHEQINELLKLIDNKRLCFIVENDKSSFKANLELLKELKQIAPLKRGYCVFNYDIKKNADFIDFLADVFKKAGDFFSKETKNYESFYIYLEKNFKRLLENDLKLYLKVRQ